ncbi:M23 family metallopeptidase [Lysobacter niastensis]|uniref:M23 family metallopeptidase n=1 Tax=Lysobacter niastensis TaxID=380629 RepID=A0ABS0B6C4_9GAMM|nr:peptidoglycan DD-metalloendopeptidase family protein [Lysobacter niastensis]MBF6024566.1 M23 family metallopeptidase [Lysobacter niastensis]
MVDRRQFLSAGAACLAASAIGGVSRAAERPGQPEAVEGFELSVQPGRVFKRSADQNRLRHEQWVFTLVLLSREPREVQIERLTIRNAAGTTVRSETTYPQAVANAINLVPAVAAQPARDRYPVAAFQVADSMAGALAIDRVACELAWRRDGKQEHLAREFPLETYRQRTELIFPFVGRGLITQGGAWNDGHRNRSGAFAIDAIGLGDVYAMMVADGDAPAATAGWGRAIIAPAAGTVVVARGDRPDQPVVGVSDPKYFAPEFPQGGDPGNHCVIDHGNGEFSLVAHLQQGSLRVRIGDHVVQGQPLGRLGNSGDSSAPHVHHQLQSGPQWTNADALPHAYRNGPRQHHDRGAIFDAIEGAAPSA